jgi:outer membrane murein-binding lipoprotein Lpp
MFHSPRKALLILLIGVIGSIVVHGCVESARGQGAENKDTIKVSISSITKQLDDVEQSLAQLKKDIEAATKQTYYLQGAADALRMQRNDLAARAAADTVVTQKKGQKK